MHTFKIEIENKEVVDKVLWFLQSLQSKGVKISKSDDKFAIDVEHCLKVLDESKNEKISDFREISSSKLFEELGI